MRTILFSKHAEITKEPNDQLEIHVFTQFFIHPKSTQRNAELRECLRINAANPYITKIHLINERTYTAVEMGVDSDKICQTVNGGGKRLKFQDVFAYIRRSNLTGFFVLTNSDIFFDDTILNLGLSDIKDQKKMFAQLRYEYLEEITDLGSSPIFGPRYDSQDTWIFHSNFPVSERQERVFNFEFGKPGCDNKLTYLVAILGYEIINDPAFVKTYHYHRETARDYGTKDRVSDPYTLIVPAGYNPAIHPNIGVGLNMAVYAQITRNHKEIQFGDNRRLYDYISNKILVDKPFIIPRISGIENNVAVFARIGKMNGTFSQDMLNYIRQVVPAMKNNAGIRLSSMASIIKYSDQYLAAFDNCEVFCGWEPQGKYIQHISQSHEFMLQQYLGVGNRACYWALALDIFHYIYDRPWTTAMAHKRILIVSQFESSFREKLNNRALLYDGVDLFPGCEFVFIKPPQTQANEDAAEFDVELARFYRQLDGIRDTYDIALLSCGGYANPACNYIFTEHKKSAIYVGGVLQMYFGVLGGRWLKERPDVVRLFLNEHWSRPKAEERPKGAENVEGGCYW
jgi:hypothetical protein